MIPRKMIKYLLQFLVKTIFWIMYTLSTHRKIEGSNSPQRGCGQVRQVSVLPWSGTPTVESPCLPRSQPLHQTRRYRLCKPRPNVPADRAVGPRTAAVAPNGSPLPTANNNQETWSQCVFVSWHVLSMYHATISILTIFRITYLLI
jgi:hypothetical protein